MFLLVIHKNPADWPGENGRPVTMSKKDQENYKEMFKLNQFNLIASDRIALNRSLPDVRMDG